MAVVIIVVVGTGTPVIKVHAHDDAAFGHGHDVHEHAHPLPAAEAPEDGDEPGATDAGTLHVHADGCVALALTPSIDRDISIHADGSSYIPRPASQPPDKPQAPLYRPPIA